MSIYPAMSSVVRTVRFDPEGWDRCELGVDAQGQPMVLPGLCRVTRANVEVKVDRKPKKGANVTRPTIGGVDPQPIELELKMFHDVDREVFAEHCTRIRPGTKAGEDPQYLNHPSLAHLRITAMQVIKIHHLVWVAPGVTTVKIEGLHWTPAPKVTPNVTKTPKHAINNKLDPAKKNPPPSQQETLVEIDGPVSRVLQ